MKATESAVIKSLQEVREWKEAVHEEVKDKTTEKKKAYFRKGLEVASQMLGARLIENPDGTYTFSSKT